MNWVQVSLDVALGILIWINIASHESLRKWSFGFYKKFEALEKDSENLSEVLSDFEDHIREIRKLRKESEKTRSDLDFWVKHIKTMRKKIEKQEQQRIDPSQVTIESLQEFVEG